MSNDLYDTVYEESKYQNISDKHKSCLQRILKLLLAWKSYSYEIIHQHLLSWSKFHPFYANNLVRCSYRCFFNTAKSNNSIIKLSYTSKFKYYFNKIVKIFNTYQLCILWLIKSLWVLPDDFSRNYVVIFVPSAVKARGYSTASYTDFLGNLLYVWGKWKLQDLLNK